MFCICHFCNTGRSFQPMAELVEVEGDGHWEDWVNPIAGQVVNLSYRFRCTSLPTTTARTPNTTPLTVPMMGPMMRIMAAGCKP